MLADRQTDTHTHTHTHYETDTLILILRCISGGAELCFNCDTYTLSSLRALLHLADPEQRNAATVAFAGAIC